MQVTKSKKLQLFLPALAIPKIIGAHFVLDIHFDYVSIIFAI
jgi:hypothetical protein